jgi:hypothetical protein
MTWNEWKSGEPNCVVFLVFLGHCSKQSINPCTLAIMMAGILADDGIKSVYVRINPSLPIIEKRDAGRWSRPDFDR